MRWLEDVVPDLTKPQSTQYNDFLCRKIVGLLSKLGKHCLQTLVILLNEKGIDVEAAIREAESVPKQKTASLGADSLLVWEARDDVLYDCVKVIGELGRLGNYLLHIFTAVSENLHQHASGLNN